MGSREGRGWCWSAGNGEAEGGDAGNREAKRGELEVENKEGMKRLRGEKLGIERPRDWRGREKGAARNGEAETGEARNGEAEKGEVGTGLLVIGSRVQGRG